jgi:hypothetical protein
MNEWYSSCFQVIIFMFKSNIHWRKHKHKQDCTDCVLGFAAFVAMSKSEKKKKKLSK